MPNCDFYAAGGDFQAILDFVYAQPGWMLVELSSVPDRPLRRFHSAAAVLDAHDLERAGALMQLYTPDLGGGIIERPIVFNRGAMGDAIGRTVSEGWGLIQLYFEGDRDGRIGLSHTNHNSEARARSWESAYAHQLGPVSAWNWTEVVRTSRRLNHHIRRTGVGRAGSRVILPEAAALVARGIALAPN